MYEYKASVTRVLDGDTFDAIIDLGFHITFQLRVRLRGIDCAETYHPVNNLEREHGLQAKTLAESLIGNKIVILRTVLDSVYNRYEADVILEDGRSLKDILLENKMQKDPMLYK